MSRSTCVTLAKHFSLPILDSLDPLLLHPAAVCLVGFCSTISQASAPEQARGQKDEGECYECDQLTIREVGFNFFASANETWIHITACAGTRSMLDQPTMQTTEHMHR